VEQKPEVREEREKHDILDFYTCEGCVAFDKGGDMIIFQKKKVILKGTKNTRKDTRRDPLKEYTESFVFLSCKLLRL
jgi:hypothetical protein